MSSSASLDVVETPTSAIAYSFFGLTCISFLYGILGTCLTVLQFFRLGFKRFFLRVERPAPPLVASNAVYGTHQMIKLKSSGISLHYVSKGLPNQPMVLFLHGFPECWYSWRHQLKYFSKDYRVVAIDQRGYGLSSKPPFVSDYRIETLAGDVADVIEQLGYESCILVAHDWGGFIAWTTAILYPHLIEKLVVMNCPHPNAFRQELSFAQLRRSWYMFFYQSPLLPELLLQADDFSILKKLFVKKPTDTNNQETMTDEDVEVFKYTLSQKGAPKAAINYYRALLRYPIGFLEATITAPVLLLWGCEDKALGEELADASQKYCSDIRVKKIANASHWVNQDVPDVVNKYMEIFFKEFAPLQQSLDF